MKSWVQKRLAAGIPTAGTCEHCGSFIQHEGIRFCSRSCAATVNNRLFPKRHAAALEKKRLRDKCAECDNSAVGQRHDLNDDHFCSLDCQRNCYRRKVADLMRSGIQSTFQVLEPERQHVQSRSIYDRSNEYVQCESIRCVACSEHVTAVMQQVRNHFIIHGVDIKDHLAQSQITALQERQRHYAQLQGESEHCCEVNALRGRYFPGRSYKEVSDAFHDARHDDLHYLEHRRHAYMTRRDCAVLLQRMRKLLPTLRCSICGASSASWKTLREKEELNLEETPSAEWRSAFNRWHEAFLAQYEFNRASKLGHLHLCTAKCWHMASDAYYRKRARERKKEHRRWQAIQTAKRSLKEVRSLLRNLESGRIKDRREALQSQPEASRQDTTSQT